MSSRRRRVLFCWAEISGYMAACFRELMQQPTLEPRFLAFASGRANSGAKFRDDIVAGLPCTLLESTEKQDAEHIVQLALEQRPEVIVLCGWFHPAYRRLVQDPRCRGIQFIMIMDTPWLGKWRQWLARIALRRFLRKMARVWVTGERSWQYARRLGVAEPRLRRGTYGIDYANFSRCYTERASQPDWPRRFFFSGRFAPEKGLDVLVAGYRRYRELVEDPWPLDCCGTGPLQAKLDGVTGLNNLGFLQPTELRQALIQAGVFVLPSTYDPWPLALVEAAGSGLPIICSEACGSSVELVRHLHNGWLGATGDSQALAAAMVAAHRSHGCLATMGARSLPLAAAYAAERWVERLVEMVDDLTTDGTEPARAGAGRVR
jgi:glycosyltransferase involved in cell wall biosynthesis